MASITTPAREMQQPPHPTNSNNLNSLDGKLDVALIHRVLLTEPSEWSDLTVSGLPRILHTLSLEEFSNDMTMINDNINSHDSMQKLVVKRAFRDYLIKQLKQSDDNSNIEPLQQLLQELHQNIRNLVPNRIDLHSLLSDEQVTATKALSDLLALLIRAGHALQQLESEARSESTAAWIEQAQQQQQQQQLGQEQTATAQLAEFITTSLLYLLYKCELCQSDKDDFYLSHVWAPRIHHQGMGVAMERKVFLQHYGNDLSSPNTAPRTRHWIQTLVINYCQTNNNSPPSQGDDAPAPSTNTRLTQLETSTAAIKRELIRTGWIQTILFRGSDQPPLELPEIFALDVDRLSRIRQVTRWAAAGSAVTLLMSHVTGVSATTLQTLAAPYTALAMRQTSLMQAIQAVASSSIEVFEQAVVDQVIALAREVKSSLDTASQEALTHRTLAVLRGQDPVLQVLDQRMKRIFLGQMEEPSVPVLRSGQNPTLASSLHDNAINNSNGNSDHALLQARQQALFVNQGLGLYASQLAMACKLANKILDVAWMVYEDAMDQMIRQACQHERERQAATTTISQQQPAA
jgi:hypothetical protein